MFDVHYGPCLDISRISIGQCAYCGRMTDRTRINAHADCIRAYNQWSRRFPNGYTIGRVYRLPR